MSENNLIHRVARGRSPFLNNCLSLACFTLEFLVRAISFGTRNGLVYLPKLKL